MSNVIKSFRVVETKSDNFSRSGNDEKEKILEVIIEEAREKANEEYERIILEANTNAFAIMEAAESQKKEIINSANNNSKEVLEEAKAKGYKIGNEDGYQKGYEIGYQEGKTEADKLIADALDIKNSYLQKKDSLLRELESDIIDLVINIYEKVINKKNEEDSDMIVSIVSNGINSLDLTDKLTIITSKTDYDILEMSKNEILASASMITELEIKYDSSLEKGDCILETSKGNIDVSLKNQLEEVRELLTTILNNE